VEREREREKGKDALSDPKPLYMSAKYHFLPKLNPFRRRRIQICIKLSNAAAVQGIIIN